MPPSASVGSTRAGVLHQLRGETPDDARAAALDLARTAAERGDRLLLVSAAAPTALAAIADRIGFDLAAAAKRGAFRLLCPAPALLHADASDDARARAFTNLLAHVRSERPAVFVLDDAAALDRFDDPSAFAAALDGLYTGLAADGIAFALTEAESQAAPAPPEPATSGSGDGAAVPEPDLSPSPLPPADLFARSTPRQGLAHAHFVSADLRGEAAALHDIVPVPEEGHVDAPGRHIAIATGADALPDRAAFDEPTGTPDDPLFPPSTPSPRLLFAEAFGAARAAYERAGVPFAAVAVRTEPTAEERVPFDAVLRAVEAVFGPGAALVAGRGRAAWLVAGTTDVAPLFSAVRAALRAACPDAAGGLRALAVAVAPNGAPFTDANAFLSYVLG